MEVRREAADVPPVAHRPERQQRDHRVLGGVQRAEQLRQLLEAFELLGLGDVPDGLGLERRLREVERDHVHRLLGRDAPALVADDLLGDLDGAEAEVEAETPLATALLEDLRLRLLLRHCVPVARERRHERRVRVEVE